MKKTKNPNVVGPKPGIRIDGGKRRDLNKQRVAGRMAGVKSGIPTAEDAKLRLDRLAKRKSEERKAAANGADGAIVTRVSVRLSSGRSVGGQMMRCRPGTFEWRYGRNKQDALFHAGSHLAILWERAGMTIASSANFLRGISSGYSTGLSEGRVQAIDKLDDFRKDLGRQSASRLIDYCVAGLTSEEIARKDGATKRDMAPVLHQDLRDCARFFNLLGK